MLNFHSLGNKPGIKYIYKAVRAWRQYGLVAMLRMVRFKITSGAADNSNKIGCPTGELYEQLLKKYQDGEIKGIAIIPSAFEFDELYNQRTINLSKYLSNNGYGVIYVAWQWHKGEVLEKNHQYVFKNVIQIPLYEFIETHNRFKLFSEISDKKFIIMLPAKVFSDMVFFMKDNCFEIYYDIMDDWERFFEVGQAPWYIKTIEEFVVLNANKITAVSQPLVQKFSYLRQDISLIGNGYYAELLGAPPAIDSEKSAMKTGNEATYKEAEQKADKNSDMEDKITIGYFGHLTESWFDWEMVFDMLEKHENIHFEIIGYGESEVIKKRVSKFSNITLLGKISPRDLHIYAKKWDIAVIPFKKSELSEAVDPIKIYEYLYFGLPTVATGIQHLQNFPFVKISDNQPQSFYKEIMELYESKLLSARLDNGKSDYEKISDFLSDKTWDKRFDKMFEPAFLSEIYK